MEIDQNNRKKYMKSMEEGIPKYTAFLIVAFFLAFIIIGFSLWSLASMQKASDKNTREYAGELTEQVAFTTQKELKDKETVLAGISDSLGKLLAANIWEDIQVKNHLSEKNKNCDFEFLIYREKNGDTRITAGSIPKGLMETLETEENRQKVHDILERNACATQIIDGNIVYAVPVYEKGQRTGYLYGGNTRKNLHKLIAVKVFQEKSHVFIATDEGEILLSAKDEEHEHLIQSIAQDPEAEEAMQKDLREKKSGTVSFQSGKGDIFYLSYSPISINDWALVTAMPSNLLAGTYHTYILQELFCAIGAAVLFVILFAAMFRTYNANKRKLEEMAFVDPITGGMNGAELQLRYDQLIRHCDPEQYAVVLMDIHGFKMINETMGRNHGDQILHQVYRTITGHLDSDRYEFAARTEMDHFFFLLCEHTRDGVQKRIDEILQDMNVSGASVDLGYDLTFAEGACFITDGTLELSVLEDRARMAEKSRDGVPGDGCAFFTDKMEKNLQKEQELDRMISRVVDTDRNELLVYFQPKVSISRGVVEGAEALVRWNHPQKGIIPPGEFIPILEKNGKIREVDWFVFEQVCAWMKEREQKGLPPITVSFNLSRAHFWKDHFLDPFLQIADRYQVSRDFLEFEITETVFLDAAEIQKIREEIRQIHQQGFRCSIDDFGTGYSSLSILRELDVDVIKLDRSFFLSLEDQKAQSVVRCIADLAKELDIDTVVEGIDSEQQIEFLKTIGCDVVQGYYYSRPLPESEFNRYLEKFGEKE